jgi:periplasmic divalent cation tolerance protein
MESGFVIVLTTIGGATDGHQLASILVTERLAACVNVLPEMESVYRWNEAVESERERQLIIKTTADRVVELRTRIHELHSYEVPEFIVLPVAGGGDTYLRWIRQSVSG